MRAVVYHGQRDLRVEEAPDPVPGSAELLRRGARGRRVRDGRRRMAARPLHLRRPRGRTRSPATQARSFPATSSPGAWSRSERASRASRRGCSSRAAPATSPDPRSRPRAGGRTSPRRMQPWGSSGTAVSPSTSRCRPTRVSTSAPTASATTPPRSPSPMAIAVHAFHRGRPQPGESALVIGAGGIGAFLAYAASQFGLNVAVADLSDERLEIAAALGASVLLGSDEIADLAQAVHDRGLDVAIVYEVTGTDAGLRSALRVAERLGATSRAGRPPRAAPRDRPPVDHAARDRVDRDERPRLRHRSPRGGAAARRSAPRVGATSPRWRFRSIWSSRRASSRSSSGGRLG